MTLRFTKAPQPDENPDEDMFEVTMEMGVIDNAYQKYFTWPNQGVIGLAPSKESDSAKLQRQFLYQVSQKYDY